MQREELKGIISLNGKTQKEVAKKLNMSVKTFNQKLNTGYFGTDDVDIMIDYLKIKDPMWIFFDRMVTLKDTKEISYKKL